MALKEQLNIGLTDEDRREIVKTLNRALADEHVLYAKLRNYHWNVVGAQFITLHELFERQYDEVKLMADELAEQARALGGNAIGTLEEFLAQTRLTERPGEHLSAHEMVADLVEANEAIVRHLREDINRTMDEYADEGTADLLIEGLNRHAQMAWMLRSLIEGEPVHGSNGSK